MRWLIDTHILLWWHAKKEKLAKDALRILNHPENEIRVSVISLWEIQLKMRRQKIKGSLNQIEDAISQTGFRLTPLLPQHIRSLEDLTKISHDPFDMMLIAQAQAMPAYFMTSDPALAKFGDWVKVFN